MSSALSKSRPSLRLAGLLTWMALTQTGCVLGPDFKTPAAPTSTGYVSEQTSIDSTARTTTDSAPPQRFNTELDIPFDWWTLFHSAHLNSLIARAFRANPNIEAAQAALQQAEAYTSAQQGYFYPTVGINYSPTRTKLAGNMGNNSPGVQGNGQNIQAYSNPAGPAPYNQPVYYNFHIAQLSVGYVPDVFGLNRRLYESSQAQAASQRFQLEATYLSLASNVVAAALQEASLRAQIRAAQRIVEINRTNSQIAARQQEKGFISEWDVATQTAALAQSEQALLPLEHQLALTRNLLRALAGEPPDQALPEVFELSDLQLPSELPLSLPSQLVAQRPDIRSAQEQLHYASAQVGVAVASRLPQFSITGAIGGMAATPDWMFRHGGGFFSLIGNIGQTLFDGGTLSAREHAARAALIQADAQYRNVVITALQNVADTLYTIESDAHALAAAKRSEEALESAWKISQNQYARGFISYQSCLLSEQQYQQAVITRIQAETNRLGDSAALYQALGGGWWHREPQHATEALALTAQPTSDGRAHAETN